MSFFESLDADLFCCFGNQATAATAIASAHSTGRRAILFLGSDDDLNPVTRPTPRCGIRTVMQAPPAIIR